MSVLPDLARDLIDGQNFAAVATIQPDGSPQCSIVWVKRDGDDVLFSTIKGRRKTVNMAANPRVSVLITDASTGYRYAEIRGAVDMTDDPDAVLIDELSRKYTDSPWQKRPGEQRVIVRVRPSHVVAYDD
jgi:PPOX class probable F420-dependent enzyme